MTSPRPVAPVPLFDHIPPALTAIAQWLLWRYERPKKERWTKVPYASDGSGKASSTNSDTWATFERAREAYLRHVQGADGIGLVLTKETGIAGVDLDHIDNPASPHERIVTLLNTYCEYSPSGEGLRLFAFGTLPPGRRKLGDVEAYVSGRYLTITGHVFGHAKEIAERTQELANFHRHYLTPKTATKREFTKPPPARHGAPNSRNSRGIPPPLKKVREGPPMSDHEVVIAMLSSTSGAKWRALWRGAWEGLYKSQSEADLALSGALLWWCQGDSTTAARLFQESGLYRDKWDRLDYQERTLSAAKGS